ncbi:DUF5667 domain-containing protein [Chloroflexota bacterium]
MKKIEEILAQSIENIMSGKAGLAECLDRYPGMRHELEPLLKVALGIKEPSVIRPSDTFKIQARVNLIERIHASQSVKNSTSAVSKSGAKQIWYSVWLKPLTIAIAAILFVSVLGTGTAYASQDSLPGDILYPVKIGTEQLQRMLTFNEAANVDLELKFSDTRLSETKAIANKRPDKIAIAITGYKSNLNKAISIAENAGNSESLLEMVSLAIIGHLSRLDEIEDIVLGVARESISSAEEIAIKGYISALQSLADINPVKATEINLGAIQMRLNRASIESKRGNSRGVEEALQQYERLRRFGEEISESSKGMGYDTTAVDELNARATAGHLETMGSIYGIVSPEIQDAVEEAMGVSVEEHGQAVKGLQQQGALGDIPEEPPIPDDIPDEVKKRIMQPESEGSGNGRR